MQEQVEANPFALSFAQLAIHDADKRRDQVTDMLAQQYADCCAGDAANNCSGNEWSPTFLAHALRLLEPSAIRRIVNYSIASNVGAPAHSSSSR